MSDEEVRICKICGLDGDEPPRSINKREEST